MPTYRYECEGCALIFEKFHLMSETLERCEKCNSSVKRLVTSTFNINKNKNLGTKKPGNIVNQYIKDVKEEIKQEKKRISTQEYEKK